VELKATLVALQQTVRERVGLAEKVDLNQGELRMFDFAMLVGFCLAVIFVVGSALYAWIIKMEKRN
jgi:hypothetical protein